MKTKQLESINELNERFKNELDEIKKEYLRLFPNGAINVGFRQIVGSPFFYCNCYLIGDKKDWINGILDNDPLNLKFIGFFDNEDYTYRPTQNEVFTLEARQNSFYVKSTKPYLVYDRVKIPFRKKKGDIVKHISNLSKVFEKAHSLIVENEDNFKDDIDSKYINCAS